MSSCKINDDFIATKLKSSLRTRLFSYTLLIDQLEFSLDLFLIWFFECSSCLVGFINKIIKKIELFDFSFRVLLNI
jgi:hypothetical protein